MGEFGEINRRSFLRTSLLGAAGVATMSAFALPYQKKNDLQKLTILHTNDMHSRIEPFPSDHPKHAGLGGMARRAAMIQKIRQQEENVLLLDAGDIFQGTPYFNVYRGELEFKLMSRMKYDAATMGNHDFDIGLDGFNNALPYADFPFICSNYDFTGTVLEGRTVPYKIFKRNGIKIGVMGLGIRLDGLVPKQLYGKTKYNDPLQVAGKYGNFLKNEKQCDLVICLSHLGLEYDTEKVSDKVLAQKTSNIDLIIGGHTHTFLDEAIELKNSDGKDVMVNQVGWAGIRLGRVDYYFEEKKKVGKGLASNLDIKSENTIKIERA